MRGLTNYIFQFSNAIQFLFACCDVVREPFKMKVRIILLVESLDFLFTGRRINRHLMDSTHSKAKHGTAPTWQAQWNSNQNLATSKRPNGLREEVGGSEAHLQPTDLGVMSAPKWYPRSDERRWCPPGRRHKKAHSLLSYLHSTSRQHEAQQIVAGFHF